MSTQHDSTLDSTFLFTQLDAYPWDSDEEFQGGLRAILGSVQDPSQVQHLTLRAKCYYYARKAGTPVDFDGYKRWVEGGHGDDVTDGESKPKAPDATSAPLGKQEVQQQDGASGGMATAPKPASFAEICEMIAEGKPIPGIKDIPDTILEGQASNTQAAKRKKPWEKDLGSAEKPSWMK